MVKMSIGSLAIAITLVGGTLALDASAHAAAAGRYKKDGAKCVWDSKDSGPNQCSPVVVGHFRRIGRNCTWDASGPGDDECRPSSGRFKKERAGCVWTATDNGPDQCDPHEAK